MKSRHWLILCVVLLACLLVVSALLTSRLAGLAVTEKPEPADLERATDLLMPGVSVTSVVETVIRDEPAAEPPASGRLVPEPVEPAAPASAREPVGVPTAAGLSPAQDAVADVREEHAGMGVIVSVRGEVFATGAKQVRRRLGERDAVFAGEKIETGSGARVGIEMGDESLISLGENSTIVVDEYSFRAKEPAKCGFVMRLVEGVCRVVTGMITDLNPDRFKVRSRMATVGIRGCDVFCRSRAERDDIYVLDLGHARAVVVETTAKGSVVMNPLTGRTLTLDSDQVRVEEVTDPKTIVSIVRGRGVERRALGAEEEREIQAETSHLAPARYRMAEEPEGAVLRLEPRKTK